MDAMMLGETLMTERETQYYGHWMPAAGSAGVAAVNVFVQQGGGAGFLVSLETKSSDEDDAAATAIGSVAITSTTPQVHRFAASGAKDLVRYVVECQSSTDYLHFQLLQPMWAPN